MILFTCLPFHTSTSEKKEVVSDFWVPNIYHVQRKRLANAVKMPTKMNQTLKVVG